MLSTYIFCEFLIELSGTFNMAMIVISGTYYCPGFAILDYVANHLSKTLPNFKVQRIVQTRKEWSPWLYKKCKSMKWYHSTSPLVWKELAMKGGSAQYIGGVDQFLEYCSEYYGAVLYQDIHKGHILAKENIERRGTELKAGQAWRRETRCRLVCVSGAGTHAGTLAARLLLLPELALAGGTRLVLRDCPGRSEELRRLAAHVSRLGAPTGLQAAVVTDDMSVALKSCHLYVILDGFPRRTGQSLEACLRANHTHMVELAREFDMFAPAGCRVVVASGNVTPTCFNATVFAGQLRRHAAENVVVVTADLGLEALAAVSRAAALPLRDLAVPPVWGFAGLDHQVDADATRHRRVVFEPSARVVGATRDSQMPLGSFRMEVREVGPLLFPRQDVRSQIKEAVEHWIVRGAVKEAQREISMAKVKATIDLLRFWYSEESDGEILCAGVMSDGTFGVPRGVVFSQPASLRDGRWRPEPLFPAPGPHVGLPRLVRAATGVLSVVGVWLGADATEPPPREAPGTEAPARRYRDPDWSARLPRLSAPTRKLVARATDEARELKKVHDAEEIKKLLEAEIMKKLKDDDTNEEEIDETNEELDEIADDEQESEED